MSSSPRVTAVIVGLGNIGSYAADLLLRSGRIPRLVVIDHDTYEPDNLSQQAIAPADVGLPKAVAQARRLRRIHPAVEVVALVTAVERAPLGYLRAAVVLGCLDSRRARQVTAEACWHLGVPYVDAGVLAGGLLARVNTYVPDPSRPCLECAWDELDYALLEQTYACVGTRSAAATNAPASLGALAAALQVIEATKQLNESSAATLSGRQLIVDAESHGHFVSEFARSPRCRFHHETWSIEELVIDFSRVTLAELCERLGASAISLPGHHFVTQLVCRDCGGTRACLRASGRLDNQLTCRRCGGAMLSVPRGASDALAVATLSRVQRARTLRSLGLAPRDVIEVKVGDEDRHFELLAPIAQPTHGDDSNERHCA